MNPEVLVVAGEASADLLAADVLGALKWPAFGVGGSACAEAGLRTLFPASALSLVGLTEVVPAVPRVLRIGAAVYQSAVHRRPAAALLVDLPDFNLLIGPLLARLGVPVVYLGAPQAWAWRPGRAFAMARWVEALACLFPFETDFFVKAGVRATFVGHPAVVRARRVRETATASAENIVPSEQDGDIVILPGSRTSELARHLPLVSELLHALATRFPARRRRLVVASTVRCEDVRKALGPASELVELVPNASPTTTMEVLSTAAIALVASGTAVTECVVMNVPPVVFYRVSPTTYAIARHLVRVEFIAMANLLAGRRLVPELVQEDATAERILLAATELLTSPSAVAALRRELATLARQLEGPDDGLTPGERVAQMVAAVASA